MDTSEETMPPPQYSSQQLDYLGLVVGRYDELGIGELLDKLIPQESEQRIVPVRQAVNAMALNGLSFVNRTLYLTELFFRDQQVEHLIGEGIILGNTIIKFNSYIKLRSI